MEYTDEECWALGSKIVGILDYYKQYFDFKIVIHYNEKEALPFEVDIVTTEDNTVIGGKSNDICLAFDAAKEKLKDYVFEKYGQPQTFCHVLETNWKNINQEKA